MTTPENSITVVALAWHEANHLRHCFKSLHTLIDLVGAQTLVVLDHEADSTTRSVAERVADRAVTSRFVSFASQRNRAIEMANTEWVFFIDADERCTDALAQEIARSINRTDCAAFRVPRRNFFFGREVRHTGWWPDYQTRLLRRARTHYDETRQVHEFPVIEGETCTLLDPLIHFNYESWGHFFKKQCSYAPLEARALYDAGNRARARSFVGQPGREFKRRFIEYQGYRDGFLGLTLSVAMSVYRAEVYRQLAHIQRREKE